VNGFSQTTDQRLEVTHLKPSGMDAPPFLMLPQADFEWRSLLPGNKPVKLLADRPFFAAMAELLNDHELERHWGINE
jgi:hypothetical protein